MGYCLLILAVVAAVDVVGAVLLCWSMCVCLFVRPCLSFFVRLCVGCLVVCVRALCVIDCLCSARCGCACLCDCVV